MSPVLLPSRPAELGSAERVAPEPEALIEEARRRARRRRAAYTGAALLTVSGALGSLFAFGGGGTTTTPRSGAGHANRGLPAAAKIVGTLPVSLQGSVLFAARARTLFELVLPPSGAGYVTVARVDPDGTATKKPIPFDRSSYLMDLSTGPDGVYAGTAVIKRFTNMPDELVRIDAKTLTIRARAFFPARVAAVEQARGMWASIGDGRVVRLDPRTLAIEASQRLLAARAVATRGVSLSKPALGLGSVWVLAGDERDLELVRLNPTSLAIRSTTRVPTRGDLGQALNRVVADSGHVSLVGRAIVAVDAAGRLIRRPAFVPDLATAEIHGTGFVGLTGGKPSLVLLDGKRRIVAKTRLVDAGAQLVVSGRDAWFLGNAGRGNGIVHVRLR
jgi:hypothetical protein